MIKDIVLKNRSYRGYDPSVPVPDEDILEMIDCARLSASSRNAQPLKYLIANDDETVKTLRGLVKYGRALPELNLPFPGEEPPAFIVICQDTDIVSGDATFAKDIGIAAQSITLAAAEMGYGACMIANYPAEKTREALGLPENLPVRLVISLGKPKEEICIEDLEEGGDFKYYRDEEGVHHVPKRRLEDILINR